MIHGDRWHLFIDNWFMSVTMVFGAFIAGATSEGGGAVAFPVMTLLFKIQPKIAKDFSLIIQAVGMMSAAITILFKKIPVEKNAIIWASIGGVFGSYVGITKLAPSLPPAFVKIFFLSLWMSFAFALVLVHRVSNLKSHSVIPNFSNKHIPTLVIIGFFGGMISGLTGSGLDLLTFSFIVLFFHINEKVATPTSVVLMGVNALIGSIINIGTGLLNFDSPAWNYWWVCVPICVLFAPLGALFIAGKSRMLIVSFLVLSIFVQYIAGLSIIPAFTQQPWITLLTMAFGSVFFYVTFRLGKVRTENR